jgi:hypothetical protein
MEFGIIVSHNMSGSLRSPAPSLLIGLVLVSAEQKKTPFTTSPLVQLRAIMSSHLLLRPELATSTAIAQGHTLFTRCD